MMKFPRIRLVWDETETTSLPPPGESAVAEASPAQAAQADAAEPTSSEKPTKPPKQRRPLWVRLLSIRIGGAFTLLLWCILAGVFMRFTGFGPFAQPQSNLERAEGMWSQFLSAAGLALQLGWKPALTGATIILPIWLGWRVITLPFRR